MADVRPAPSPGTIEAVRALLAGAGLNPPEAEIETMAAAYPGFRAAADRLYPLVYDDDPAPVFDPTVLFPAAQFPAGPDA
ncbi:MAG TPA: hypothetical protein VGG83_02655 [Trebonia sp.]|jgi:hypothetical protein